MKKTLMVRAPVRIDFAGGPSDVPPFSMREWGYVINASINRYATVTINKRSDEHITIMSKDFNAYQVYSSFSSLTHDPPVRLITHAIEMLQIQCGLDITLETNVPVGSGLGASAAVSISTLYALHKVIEDSKEPDRENLAWEAIELESDRIGNVGGGQDQFASAFGGFQSFRFESGSISRKELPVSHKALDALSDRLLLCYSGTSHISGNVLSDIMEKYTQGDTTTTRNLYRLRKTASDIETLIISEPENVHDLGNLLTIAWVTQKSLHCEVSTPEIEKILDIARSNGSKGGKVTGAGGGGCVLIACEPEKKTAIASALEKSSFLTMPFQFVNQGVICAEYVSS